MITLIQVEFVYFSRRMQACDRVKQKPQQKTNKGMKKGKDKGTHYITRVYAAIKFCLNLLSA